MTVLVIQPDETASQDTFIQQSYPTAAYDTINQLAFRNWLSTYEAIIPLVKFPLTNLPSGAIISAASLAITLAQAAQRTTSPTWRRILPANSGWVEGATWNHANPTTSLVWAGDTGGDGGQDAGCRVSGVDISDTPIGSFNMTAGDAIGTVYTANLDLTEFGYMIANNCGFLLAYAAGAAEQAHSSKATTPSNRPVLTVTYTEAGGLHRINMNAQMQSLNGGMHG